MKSLNNKMILLGFTYNWNVFQYLVFGKVSFCIDIKVEVKLMGFQRRGFGPREMHKAVCADCGKECEVPFVPKEGRPVYCRECYSKHRRY